jgi:hypothetical protein
LSINNKTEHNVLSEIVLKVTLNTHKRKNKIYAVIKFMRIFRFQWCNTSCQFREIKFIVLLH